MSAFDPKRTSRQCSPMSASEPSRHTIHDTNLAHVECLLFTLWSIGNRSCQIGVVYQLEATFTAILACGGERYVFRIGEEAFDGLRRRKLNQCDKVSFQGLAF